MKRPWLVWLSFGLCVAVVLAAMGWISFAALRAESAETVANARAEFEDAVAPALWQMDALLGSVLAQEPYFAFMTPDQTATPLQTTLPKNMPPYVLLPFKCLPDGQFASPWVVKNAAKSKLSAESLKLIQTAEKRLGELAKFVTYQALAERLTADDTRASESLVLSRDDGPIEPVVLNSQNENYRDLPFQGRGRRNDIQQSQINNAQFMARQEGVQRLVDSNRKQGTLSILGDMRVGEMNRVWLDRHLLLVRRVRSGSGDRQKEYLQGAWLDWQSLQEVLLKEVAGAFPEASLRPLTTTTSDDPATNGRRLAALPVEFVPGQPPDSVALGWTPMRISLAVAWGCMLLAATAVAGLLLGVLRLSERRAAFVSAVTHELRTPLTTFRMYADMLARGMVPQPERQQQYLNTLRVESDRLTHLVANVLAYARLERGRPVRQLQTVTLGDLVSQTQARLTDRAAQGGLELRVSLDPSAASAAVRCDPSVVEQILFNLVDNSCKYAANGLPPVVELSAGRAAQGVILRVRDHGPGIAPSDRRRVFRTFGKSAHQAANSAPGVGLGLGLSRRLARGMAGDLRLEPKNGQGAAFVLTLRGESQSAH